MPLFAGNDINDSFVGAASLSDFTRTKFVETRKPQQILFWFVIRVRLLMSCVLHIKVNYVTA